MSEEKKADEISIEDDIPIPRIGAMTEKYPWRKLEIGQSFAAPMSNGTVGSMLKQAKSQGIYLVSRTVSKGAEGGPPMRRIWRVEPKEENES